MKPISVTVDFSPSMDGLAIEACFEKSMLSENGKLEEGEHSLRSRREPFWVEEREMKEGDEDPRLFSFEQTLCEIRESVDSLKDLDDHSLEETKSSQGTEDYISEESDLSHHTEEHPLEQTKLSQDVNGHIHEETESLQHNVDPQENESPPDADGTVPEDTESSHGTDDQLVLGEGSTLTVVVGCPPEPTECESPQSCQDSKKEAESSQDTVVHSPEEAEAPQNNEDPLLLENDSPHDIEGHSVEDTESRQETEEPQFLESGSPQHIYNDYPDKTESSQDPEKHLPNGIQSDQSIDNHFPEETEWGQETDDQFPPESESPHSTPENPPLRTETPRYFRSQHGNGSFSDESYIEAEYEMVLDDDDLSRKDEFMGCAEDIDDENENALDDVVDFSLKDEPSGCVESVGADYETVHYDADYLEKEQETHEAHLGIPDMTSTRDDVLLGHEGKDRENVVVWFKGTSFSSAQSLESEASVSEEEAADSSQQKQFDTTSSEETPRTYNEMSSLASLIEQRNWDKVVDRLEELESISTVEVWTSGLDALGDSLLLEICKHQPTLHVIESWVQSFPKDPERQCLEGRLPLHYACSYNASVQVVEALIHAFPQSLMSADVQDRMLPLHCACKEGATGDVIDVLLMAYPEATLVQDIHGKTPMDYAMNLEDRSLRDGTVVSIQKSLKQNLSTLADLLCRSHNLLGEEQQKVKDLERKIQLEMEKNSSKILEFQSSLQHALERVAILEKSEAEKVAHIQQLGQKLQEAQSFLEEARLILSEEKDEVLIKKTKELESALMIEQGKIDSLEQSLAEKQDLLVQVEERSFETLQKFTETKAELAIEKIRSKQLEESLAATCKQEDDICRERRAEGEATQTDTKEAKEQTPSSTTVEIELEEARIVKLEEIRLEYEAMMKKNEEIIQAVELSNAKKIEMLEIQQEKVEALERVHREKETLLQKNQEAMKALENNIERKNFLQRGEEEKIRQLDLLRIRKREMIELEEEQVRKLDYTLSRKQALLELEQMKEKTLKQTIERKNALLETEKGKVEKLEKARADQESLLAAEKEAVQALASSKEEKEAMLRAEMKVIEELSEVLAEKERLFARKEMTRMALEQKIKEAESMVAKERELWQTAKQIKDDSEAMLREADDDVKAVEIRTSQKLDLLAKEEIMTKSLEKLRQRHSDLASRGRLYTFVDTTLSISLLVKEALLSKRHEQLLTEERKPRAPLSSTSTLVKRNFQNILPAASNLFRKALSGNSRLYLNQFVGYMGLSDSTARKHANS